MAKIRFFENFRKQNINGNNENHRDDFRSKLIRHRLLMFYRTVIIIAVIAAITLIVYIGEVNREYNEYDILSDEDRIYSEDAVYLPYGNNVLKYSKDGAEAFDGNNNAIWNQTYEMQNPQAAVCGEWAALGDFKGNSIFIMNSDGAAGEISTKLPVSAFCISETGVVAAVLEDDDETRINLYNTQGEILVAMKCTMSKSGYPADISLSPDGLKLAVSYMRIENGKLKSSVAFYNFDEVGQNEIDNYVSGYDYVDTVVPKVKFINSETAFALGDNRLVIYKGSQKPISYFETYLNEEVQSVYYSKNAIALVFRGNGGDAASRVDVYSDKGDLKFSKGFNIQYTDIVLNEDSIIIYNDIDCLMYMYNGKEKYNGMFEDPVLLLVPKDSLNKWTLVSRDAVQTVQLK